MAVRDNKEKQPLANAPKKAPQSTLSPAGAKVRRGNSDEIPPLSMSGIRSGLLHSMGVKIMMGLLILIFAVGFAFQSLNSGGMPSAGRGAPGGDGPDPVAAVGAQTISRNQYALASAQQIRMMEQFGQQTGVADLLSMRQRSLQNLLDQAATYEAAEKAGITVSDADIDKKIDEQIAEATKPQNGQSEAAFRREIEAQSGSIDAYKAKIRENYTSEAREELRKQLMIEGLQKKIQDANKVTEDDYKRSVTKLHLYQIKIAPKFPTTTNGQDLKTLQDKNAADAKAKAEKLVAGLKGKSGAALTSAFIAAAKANSDDAATKAKGGEIGWKLPAELPLAVPMRDAIVESKDKLIGPLQDEMTKDSYIFLVAGEKLELPKDYAKKKAQYQKDFETQRDNEAWTKYQDQIKKEAAASIAINDPALQALKIQTEQVFSAPADKQAGLRNEALAKYQEALGYATPLEEAAIYYQMAQLYRDTQQPAKQVEVLQKAEEKSNNDKMVTLELARALRETNKKDDALKKLGTLSKTLDDAPPASSMMMGGGNPNDQLRYQIAAEYEVLGKKDLADKERKKITPPSPQPMNGMGGMGGSPMINVKPQ